MKDIKIAIVCDWLTGIGGAERVVLELHKMLPEAPIYTSQYDPESIDWFKNADVRTTWLQKFPKVLRKFLPVFRAWSFSRLDLSAYDLVISAGGAEAKFVKPRGKHIYYCYAPTHYYWSRYEEYMKSPGFGVFNWLARLGLKLLVGPMRRWDYKAAQRPDYIIGISAHIQKEIKKYYGRQSDLIHPPVDVQRFEKEHKTERRGFVTAGRQVPYKRFDLAILACTDSNLPLTVIGDGPEHNNLKKIAGSNITFLKSADDNDVVNYLSSAEAFIFPGLDDFGITPVEAMAAGTPVIAYRAGGALDYVIPKKTGEFFTEQSADALSAALLKFKPGEYNSSSIKLEAKKFSPQVFKKKIKQFIEETAL